MILYQVLTQISKSVDTAKQLAASDTRTEQDTLDFWKIPSIIGKYTPDALRFSDNNEKDN